MGVSSLSYVSSEDLVQFVRFEGVFAAPSRAFVMEPWEESESFSVMQFDYRDTTAQCRRESKTRQAFCRLTHLLFTRHMT